MTDRLEAGARQENAPQMGEALEERNGNSKEIVAELVAKCTPPSYFQAYGQSLLDNGYPIIPIKPGHKRPALSGWQNARMSTNDLAKYPNHGVGVLCGQGAQPIAAIDIDTLDEALADRFAAWCHDNLGPTCERVGQAPKVLLVYRAAVEGWGKATGAWFEDLSSARHRVEILGNGQQFVAYHTHPDTGRSYAWTDIFGGLEAMRAGDLPVITEAQVEEALQVFEAMAEEAGLVRVSGSRSKAGGLTSAPVDDPLMAFEPPVGIDLAEAKRLVGYVDNEDYDTWLKVGMSLHHEFDGGIEALDLWDEWSSTASNYASREDLEKRWESFGRSGRNPTTARWLLKVGNQGKREAAQAAESEISFVDFSALAFSEPPPRQWIVQEWVPRNAVTALFGRGGHGKSLLAQQMAVAVANGMNFLEVSTVTGPVLGLFCEDDADELLRRGSALFDASMIEAAEGCSRLFLDARAGKFNTLISFGPDRLPAPTYLMAELHKQCEAIRPALVILDNIAQLFAGQENARTEVTSFCNELTGIARGFNCAVLLLGHTAKNEGSEYSGSTAWDAAVRSRLFFERQEDGTAVLKKAKANYSALDEIRVEYRAGAFFPLPVGTETSPAVVDATKPLILKAVETFTARQQSTSHLPTARNYLIKAMKAEQMLGGISEKVAHATMVSMIDAGELEPNSILPWKTSSRHPVQGLAVAAK